MNADIKKAADMHPDFKVVYKDAQNDTLKQVSQIEEFVSAGVDLLIVSPKEAAPLTPPVAAALKKGIPVIVLDRRERSDRHGARNPRWQDRGEGSHAVIARIYVGKPGQGRRSVERRVGEAE
ncbi:MAG: substrate-binding domain-containing protein [Verrucomicrobiota bacterium]|nr:substrate-binding domain-containing protein [Verrucomicrobiota bacterium]